MNTGKTFAVVGGDLRQAHLANTLAERDEEYRVFGMFLEDGVKLSARIKKSNDINNIFPECDIVIFPLPLLGPKGLVNTPQAKDGLTMEECLGKLPPSAVVLAGMAPPDVLKQANERGIELIDYFEREEFAVLNAIPTALYKILSNI